MLDKEIKNLKENFEVETSKNVKLEQAVKNLNQENGIWNQTLTDQIKNLNEKLEVKTSTIAEFQQDVKNLNQEIETFNKNNETLKEEVNDSKQKYSIQYKKCETLKSQHDILMDILTISDDKRNFLSLREELECLKNSYVQEKEKAESLAIALLPIPADNEDLVGKYAEVNEEIKVLKEKLIESETNSSNYEQEMGRLKLENEDLNKKFGVFGYLFKK